MNDTPILGSHRRRRTPIPCETCGGKMTQLYDRGIYTLTCPLGHTKEPSTGAPHEEQQTA